MGLLNSLAIAVGALSFSVSAFQVEDVALFRKGIRMPGKSTEAAAEIKNATFQQNIDHSNPALGTFSQLYYYSDEHYKGPGSPIVFFTPGELNITGYESYLTTSRISGVLAERIGAGIVVMEHRYWGSSSPYAELTTSNMRYLTLANSIADLNNFAANVTLPFDTERTSSADKAPWVFVGGSYSGALAAWTASIAPGTIWAYLASSAPVQSISDYWGYFAPVQLGMPANCSKDVSLVIDHIDSVFDNGTAEEQTNLKDMFGLAALEYPGDFGAAIENGPWLWQSNQFYRSGGFYEWCDAVEGVSNTTNATLPGPEGVGLEKALAGYASWVNSTLIPGYCANYGYTDDEMDISCLDTYDPNNRLYTDTTLSNTADRQWTWMLCNDAFGYWQDGAPAGRPSIVSRHVTAEYWQRQCELYYPTAPDGFTFGTARGVTADTENAYTGGWDITNTTRLIYTNGDFDPWREASVSSDERPNGPLQSTPEVPVNIVPGGFHVSDFVTQNGQVNPGVQAVIDKEIQQLVDWVGEWPGTS